MAEFFLKKCVCVNVVLHETAKVCVCPLTLGVLGVLDVVVPRGGLKKKPRF